MNGLSRRLLLAARTMTDWGIDLEEKYYAFGHRQAAHAVKGVKILPGDRARCFCHSGEECMVCRRRAAERYLLAVAITEGHTKELLEEARKLGRFQQFIARAMYRVGRAHGLETGVTQWAVVNQRRA